MAIPECSTLIRGGFLGGPFRGEHIVEDNAEDILKRLLRLVQVASNPKLVDQSYTATPGKFPRFLSLLKEATGAGSKAIVWTSFVDNADWLGGQLAAFNPAIVHGDKDIDERNAAVRTFKTDKECRILVATPGAAKEELTLTVANHAIFYDRSFSLDDYLQAQDRIQRISQGQTCSCRISSAKIQSTSGLTCFYRPNGSPRNWRRRTFQQMNTANALVTTSGD